MSDAGDGAWFQVRTRRLGWGYSYVPVTWQGWAMAVGLGPLIVATVLLGDPTVSRRSNIPLFLKTKAMLGLSGAHLPPVTVTALIMAEVAVFLLLLFWKSRPLRPLD
jgi:hypothetical protein